MLQRQIIFKQLQAMQQRQQLQELSDARQQHYLNQLSVLNRHTSGLQSSSMNGMPIQDASQMFMGANMHLTQRGTPPMVQGFSNGYVFSQAQNQPIYSMGLPQQLDPSFYGTPGANSGNDVNAFSHIQGTSHDSVNLLNTGNNSQLEMPLMQPSILSNSFVNEPFNPPVDKVCTTNGGFVQKNLGDKNFYGQLLMQPSEAGVLPANFQPPESLQKNTLLKESAMRQEQAGWPLLSAGKTSRLEPSRDATSLDPLEEKILFNTDDNWESPLGQHNNLVTVGFESTRQHGDFMGSFSANHSGSWSALMQSAVAEASSSDTGQQEEWSGLTFQNPELSADNDQANYICDAQQRSWVDNNLQSMPSPSSKPEVVFHHSKMNYNSSTEESDHLVTGQKEGMHSGFLQESTQQFAKNVTKWFDYNSQQKLPVEGFQLVQNSPPPQSVWHDQHHVHLKNDCRQLNIPSYSMDSNPYNSLTGHELKADGWQHESVPQHMVGGSRRPSDEAPLSWSNEEQGYVEQVNYVDNIADTGMNPEKVHSPDTVSSLQVPQIENQNDISSASQGIQLRMVPPSQQVPISFSSPLQAHSNVANTSVPWYQNNQLQYQDHSVTSAVNQPPCTTLLSVTDRAQAKIAPSRASCDLFQTGIEDSIYSNKDNASGTGPVQQNCFQVGENLKEVDPYSERRGFECKEEQVHQLNSCKASSSFSSNRSVHEHRAVASHVAGANATTAVSTISQHPEFDKVEQRDINAHVNAKNFDAFDRFTGAHRLLQNFPLLRQVNANARQQFLFRLQSGFQNLAQGYNNVNSQMNFIPSGENKPTSSSGSGGNQSGNNLSEAFIQDSRVLSSGETETPSHPQEQSLINVQMNPSWFKHYGTMKNGQMLPISDLMHKITAAKQLCNGKSVENFQVIHSIGQVDPSNASQVRSILPNSDVKKVPDKQLSGDTLQNLAVVRPKKRKFAVFDLLPWHKEVTQSLQSLRKFSSMAESEWALASNRLREKVEDEAMTEDILPSSQAKKRLVLTTKLMQQVFRPAPRVILSADAWSNSESVIYFVARLALGDACSLASGSHKPPFTSNMSSKELGTSERVGQLNFSKAVEEFNDRAKKLENDLLRMDKAASVLEIKVESQELEKFSVINRFAKFHSKGHSSTSVNASGVNPAVPKAGTQRYVVAHSMPKVVPEGMNCISL